MRVVSGDGVMTRLMQGCLPGSRPWRIISRILLSAAVVAVTASCAINPRTGRPEIAPVVRAKFTSIFDNPNPCANTGRNVGLVAGAVLGLVAAHFIGKSNAKLALGAVIGGTLGGLIGHSIDERRCALYKIAKAHHLSLATATITPAKLGISTHGETAAKQTLGLDVQLRNQTDEFEPGTANLTPAAKKYFGQIAEQYAPARLLARLPANASAAQRQAAEHRKVLIVGHTGESDAVSGVKLAALSQARAHAVAELFAAHGVPMQDIEYQGAGDAQPIASNATAQGRADNARVQIVDLPNLGTLKRYVAQRTTNAADFRDARSAPQGGTGSGGHETLVAARTTQTRAATRSAAVAPTVRGSGGRAGPTRPWRRRTMRSSLAAYGFDGQRLNSNYVVNLGAAQKHSMFSLVSAAHASTPVLVGSCLADHPHITTAIRNLATGRALAIDDALPGLYGEPWEGTQGRSAIALLHVYVPRDAAAPVPGVTVEFYRTENRLGRQRVKLLKIVRNASVNVYRGGRAILYRVFINAPAQCLDIDIPVGSASGHGLVVYRSDGREFAAHGIYLSKG